jgi:ATP-binding protein involved in chromosome partitioning
MPKDKLNGRGSATGEKAARERAEEQAQLEERIGARMARISHKLLIASGKGGVGKSTAAVNLGVGLAEAGETVALLDADMHGPTVPRMLGLRGVRPVGGEDGIEPVKFGERLVVMSIAFLIPHDSDAVIWRGPLKGKMVDNFLADIDWGERDWLVVDTPPGTGDEVLSAAQRVKDFDGLIMVTTPQETAVASARKSLTFATKTQTPILGVIENMGPFTCPKCGYEMRPFGVGGGERVAAEFGVPFLGSVPFDPEVVPEADEGRPLLLSRPESPAAAAWRDIVEKVRGLATRGAGLDADSPEAENETATSG